MSLSKSTLKLHFKKVEQIHLRKGDGVYPRGGANQPLEKGMRGLPP